MRYFLTLIFVIQLKAVTTAFSFCPDTAANNHYYIIHSIQLEGNKVTKDHIILRELPFAVGDTIMKDELTEVLEQTRYNLTNARLFNFIYFHKEELDSNRLNITVEVVERWYTFPIPFVEIAERNFNDWWEDKDFSRLDYGMYLIRYNFRGRKENLIALVRLGFNEQFRLTYEIPYVNRKQTIGLGFTGAYSRHKEIYYTSKDNQLQFYKNPDKPVRQEIDGGFNITYRQGIYARHKWGAHYYSATASDTITELNPKYFIGQRDFLEYFSLFYEFQYEMRDNKIYPLHGHFFEFLLTKYGLGILNNENLDVWTGELSAKKYWELYKRFYFAAGLKTKISNNAFQPYYLQRGLGFFEDFVRAYELYVIDGQHYGLLKSNLKYAIIPTRVLKLNFIPEGRFNPIPYALYGNIFFDSGYVVDRQFDDRNPLSNSWLYGTGIGIDFVTYYDRVLRLEYSLNKFGETGFFIHFTASI